MTGVGGRPELVIEGSNDEQDWKVHSNIYMYVLFIFLTDSTVELLQQNHTYIYTNTRHCRTIKPATRCKWCVQVLG